MGGYDFGGCQLSVNRRDRKEGWKKVTWVFAVCVSRWMTVGWFRKVGAFLYIQSGVKRPWSWEVWGGIPEGRLSGSEACIAGLQR